MVVVRSVIAAILIVSACSHQEPAAPPAAQTQANQPAPAPPPPPTPGTPTPVTPTPAAGAFDITKPCSMITAAEVSAIVGFAVTAVDEQYRCKFPDTKGGWLTVSLLEASLRSAKEICEYAPNKRTVVAGVGDSASYLGSTVCVKLGDVAIIVDGSNVAEQSEQLRRSGAENVFVLIGKTIASRIP